MTVGFQLVIGLDTLLIVLKIGFEFVNFIPCSKILQNIYHLRTEYMKHATKFKWKEIGVKFQLLIWHVRYTAYNISCYDNEHVLPWWGWSWLWWWLWDNPGPQTPGPATGREPKRRSLETSWRRREWSRMGIFRFQRWVFIVTTPGTPRGKKFRISIK